ncbi:MAG: hypothetical protein R3250_08295, partial [Melioribacteraceae bacterium]|nr:hypothetical protein [Melioribacteraceae bacterium]
MLRKTMLLGFLPFVAVNILSITDKTISETIILNEPINENKISSVFGSYNEKDSSNIPDEIISESSAGTVSFPHLYHYEDEEIECVECHHEMNAQNIDIPHEEYFEDFWIKCYECHS